MSDPLAQYRKKPVGTVAEPPPPKGPEEYAAFDAKDKVDRLSIRQANRQSRTPAYCYLLDITHDGPYGTNFVLYYTPRSIQLLLPLIDCEPRDYWSTMKIPALITLVCIMIYLALESSLPGDWTKVAVAITLGMAALAVGTLMQRNHLNDEVALWRISASGSY